ncbi:hypothetical protein CHUAL_010410 [Chamberlinius hualienensis]
MDTHLRSFSLCLGQLFIWIYAGLFMHQLPVANAQVKIFIIERNSTDGDVFQFNGDNNNLVENVCNANSTYCQIYGPDCKCAEEDGNYHCICPSALDYTLRLAAGIAIILLVGVSIMLAFSLYRRAMIMRRSNRSGRSDSVCSDSTTDSDSPPSYEITIISSQNMENSDSEKLPTYDEALEYLKHVASTNNSNVLVVS